MEFTDGKVVGKIIIGGGKSFASHFAVPIAQAGKSIQERHHTGSSTRVAVCSTRTIGELSNVPGGQVRASLEDS